MVRHWQANCATNYDESEVCQAVLVHDHRDFAMFVRCANRQYASTLSWQPRHLLVNLKKAGFSWTTGFPWFPWQTWFSWFHDFLAPYCNWWGFWQDNSVRENGARLYGPRVSNFLSHRIAKSLICMISGNFKFQCTRNGNRNHQFCPGSPQNTFFFDISNPSCFLRNMFIT